MAIVIEAITTALGLKKLEEGKSLIKAQMVKVPIRINKNIAEPLLKKDLIKKNPDGFYALTVKGRKVKIKLHTINISLEQFFILKDQFDPFVRKHTNRLRPIYKLMITTCLACGEEGGRLENIVDAEGFAGFYCKKCLVSKGYKTCREEVQTRINNVNQRKNH